VKVIWTPRAAIDLDGMIDYIAMDSPDSAIRVASKIYNQVMDLSSMPSIGRIGALPGTRELLFNPWPYIAVYRITSGTVRVLRIRHAAQQWP